MEMSVKNYFGTTTHLIIDAENVHIEEDISEYLHEDKNYDISDRALEKILQVAEDIVYYRQRDFDSSSLIKGLFKKLPEEVRSDLLEELKYDYE